MVPHVAAVQPTGFNPCSLDHNHAVNAVQVLQSGIDIFFERYTLAASYALVSGNHHFAGRIVDAVLECFGREAAENNRVNCPDARAGQHGKGCLWNHRHVDAYTIALADAPLLERIGETADMILEFLIGE